MTPESFDALRALMRAGDTPSMRAARAVLTQGARAVDVAPLEGVAVQSVRNAVQRVRRAADLVRTAAAGLPATQGAPRAAQGAPRAAQGAPRAAQGAPRAAQGRG